jgi:hypothetical protein
MKNKSKVFTKFKEFKVLVENQSRLEIKVLILDSGGEYFSNEFDEFCKHVGII